MNLNQINDKIVEIEKQRTELKNNIMYQEKILATYETALTEIKNELTLLVWSDSALKNDTIRKAQLEISLKKQDSYPDLFEKIQAAKYRIKALEIELRLNLTDLNYFKRCYEIGMKE